MMNKDFNENEAIRYFLGELSETELAAVEERFFADEEFSAFLDDIETDLIDSYVGGELDFSQKRKFEENFLVSERRQARVKTAAILSEKEKSYAPVAIAEISNPSLWESLKGFFNVPNLAYSSLGILFLALIGGLIWFLQRPSEIVKIGNQNIQITPELMPSSTVSLISTPNINTSPNVNSSTNEKTSTKENPKPIEPKKIPDPIEKKDEPKKETQPQPRQVSPVMARLDLFSSNSRSGGNESNKIILNSQTSGVSLRIRFKTEEEFLKFRIELRDAGGNLVSSRNVPNKNSLNLTIPAKNLRRGNYKITLKGAKTDQEFEDLDFFDLIVEKK